MQSLFAGARLRLNLPLKARFSSLVFLLALSSFAAYSQESDAKSRPVVVQPGAPGQPTKELSSSKMAVLPTISAKDVEFMKGMIMHHAQAVEMTDMIKSRTENKSIRLIGARIAQSQVDEMAFMKRWLELRGETASMQMAHSEPASMSGHHHHSALMPGMLSAKQMEALKNAKGAEFERLFLTGMIQHHNGALVMVKDLFDTAGAGQDAELFNFASDVDSGQRAEIKSMQNLLGEKPV